MRYGFIVPGLLLCLALFLPFSAQASLISGQGHGGNQIIHTGHLDWSCQNPSEEEHPDWERIIGSFSGERGRQREHAGEHYRNHHEDGASEDNGDENPCPPGLEEICGGDYPDDDRGSHGRWHRDFPPESEGNNPAAAVPEPGSLLLIGGGLLGLAGIRHRADRNGS